MTELSYHIITTPIHSLKIEYDDKFLHRLSFVAERTSVHASAPSSSPVLATTLAALDAIFSHQAIDLDTLPLRPAATPFADKLRQLLINIPAGDTLTYAQAATMLGSHPRAIGQGCRRNPYPILVPCHRIVARDHIGGFVGQTTGEHIDIKQRLLDFELIK